MKYTEAEALYLQKLKTRITDLEDEYFQNAKRQTELLNMLDVAKREVLELDPIKPGVLIVERGWARTGRDWPEDGREFW